MDTYVVRPPTKLLRFDLRELWRFRELLVFLVWRDLKVRYKQTLLGAAWAVLQPLLLMTVFFIFLGKLAGVPSDNVPYPLFAYSGLVAWTFFSQALNGASLSLVGSSNMISKVYFPRVLLPAAAVLSYIVDFLVGFLVLIPLMLYFDHSPSLTIIWAPVFFFLVVLAALGIGLWLSAINVWYRDVKYAVPFLIQLWLFATPVAYPTSLVPERFRWIVGLNPMAGAIDGFRWAVLGVGEGLQSATLVSLGATLVVLLGGLVYFQRVEKTFADVI